VQRRPRTRGRGRHAQGKGRNLAGKAQVGECDVSERREYVEQRVFGPPRSNWRNARGIIRVAGRSRASSGYPCTRSFNISIAMKSLGHPQPGAISRTATAVTPHTPPATARVKCASEGHAWEPSNLTGVARSPVHHRDRQAASTSANIAYADHSARQSVDPSLRTGCTMARSERRTERLTSGSRKKTRTAPEGGAGFEPARAGISG